MRNEQYDHNKQYYFDVHPSIMNDSLSKTSGLAQDSLSKTSGFAQDSLSKTSGLAQDSLSKTSGLAQDSLSKTSGLAQDSITPFTSWPSLAISSSSSSTSNYESNKQRRINNYDNSDFKSDPKLSMPMTGVKSANFNEILHCVPYDKNQDDNNFFRKNTGKIRLCMYEELCDTFNKNETSFDIHHNNTFFHLKKRHYLNLITIFNFSAIEFKYNFFTLKYYSFKMNDLSNEGVYISYNDYYTNKLIIGARANKMNIGKQILEMYLNKDTNICYEMFKDITNNCACDKIHIINNGIIRYIMEACEQNPKYLNSSDEKNSESNVCASLDCIPSKKIKIEENTQEIFDNVREKIKEISNNISIKESCSSEEKMRQIALQKINNKKLILPSPIELPPDESSTVETPTVETPTVEPLLVESLIKPTNDESTIKKLKIITRTGRHVTGGTISNNTRINIDDSNNTEHHKRHSRSHTRSRSYENNYRKRKHVLDKKSSTSKHVLDKKSSTSKHVSDKDSSMSKRVSDEKLLAIKKDIVWTHDQIKELYKKEEKLYKKFKELCD
jgi:hypothetical protein